MDIQFDFARRAQLLYMFRSQHHIRNELTVHNVHVQYVYAAAFKRIERFRRSAPRGDAHHRRRNHRFIHQNISFVRARSISAARSDEYYTIKFVRCQPKNSIFS